MVLTSSKDEATGRWTLHGVESSQHTFMKMCYMLRFGINFKFARYGDGEFLCMSGKVGRNCDQHEYFADLGQALNNAFYSDPNYMVGIQPLSVHGGLYQKALQFAPGPRHIYDADVLHSASIDGKLGLLMEALKDRYTIMVGAGHLMQMDFSDHVLIPNLNCWKDYDNIVFRLHRAIEIVKSPVILLCASMMSEVLIDACDILECTMIDCGSVFDPYVNKLSRSYHHKKQQWTLN